MLAKSFGFLNFHSVTYGAGLFNLAILSAVYFRDNVLNPLVSVLSGNSLVFIAALVAERAFILTNTRDTLILFVANSRLQSSFKLPVMEVGGVVSFPFFTFTQYYSAARANDLIFPTALYTSRLYIRNFLPKSIILSVLRPVISIHHAIGTFRGIGFFKFAKRADPNGRRLRVGAI